MRSFYINLVLLRDPCLENVCNILDRCFVKTTPCVYDSDKPRALHFMKRFSLLVKVNLVKGGSVSPNHFVGYVNGQFGKVRD
jgi:hypothetical protein